MTLVADKPRFAWRVGLHVAKQVCDAMKPACDRIIVAGSLRRKKPTIGDVEILYISQTEERPSGLFDKQTISLVDEVIARLEREGILERRKNVNGSEVFGAKNKLMRHVETGLPVDLFAATYNNWWNYLVCRTGPSQSNIAICEAAKARGMKWTPYGEGFTRNGEVIPVGSEEDVFAIVGLPYREPKDRT